MMGGADVKPSTKKREREIDVEVVRVEPSRGSKGGDYPCAPLVATMPCSTLDPKALKGVELYASRDVRDANVVVGRSSSRDGGLDFVGSTLRSISSPARFVVGFLSRRRGTLRVVAGDSGVVALKLRKHTASEGKEGDVMDQIDLLRAFGTARNKRAIAKAERSAFGGGGEKANLFISPDRVTKWAQERSVEHGLTEASQLEALEDARNKELPPHDLDATEPEAAYPLLRFVSEAAKDAMMAMDGIMAMVTNGTTEGCCRYVKEYVAGLADDRKEDPNVQIGLALFEVLFWLFKAKRRIQADAVTTLAEKLGLPAVLVEDLLPHTYTLVDGPGGGNAMQFVRSDQQRLRVMRMLVCTLLMLEGYECGVKRAAELLDVTPDDLRKVCVSLGCRIDRKQTVTLLKGESGPLRDNLPQVKLKRIMGRR